MPSQKLVAQTGPMLWQHKAQLLGGKRSANAVQKHWGLMQRTRSDAGTKSDVGSSSSGTGSSGSGTGTSDASDSDAVRHTQNKWPSREAHTKRHSKLSHKRSLAAPSTAAKYQKVRNDAKDPPPPRPRVPTAPLCLVRIPLSRDPSSP